MLNDWQWVKVDGSEYRLKDDYDHMIAYIIHNFDDRWVCHFYGADDWDMTFAIAFVGLENPEEVIRQATLWIEMTCNRVANSFHHIRDHLPRLEERS